MLTEPIRVTLLVTSVLENLNVPYFIVGSLASTVHGAPRTTMDVDLVADLHPEHIQPFISALENAFYIDSEMIRDSILHRSSFNILHRETIFKVDIFLPKGRPFEREQFQRRMATILCLDPERTAFIESPEDVILAKLEWFRLGGGVSEQQWNDLLNVLKVQEGLLDYQYMEKWSIQLNVANLLARALKEL